MSTNDDNGHGSIDFIDSTTATERIARRRAKKRLRHKNKKERHCKNLTLPLDLKKCAGDTYTLDETFGKFSGKWIITKVEHRIGQGAVTNLTLRRTLKGY
jgi:hypothetical protein